VSALPSGGSAAERDLEVSALATGTPREPAWPVPGEAAWHAPADLGHRYELLDRLGEGGLGIVFRARAIDTGQQVAIKFLRPELVTHPRARAFFLKEGRHLAALEHPHIMPVIECGELDGACWLVMPYLQGGSLGALLTPGKPLERGTALALAEQVASALAYAHRHSIIHRDLKPSNILLEEPGQARLADFGLAQSLFNDELVDPRGFHIEGTPQYLSPAAARGEAEDTRGDIYAFGAVLYQMLTGRPPYTGASRQEVIAQIRAGPPPPILAVAPDACPALAAIAAGAMARNLQDRYVHISYVVEDLARIQRRQPPLGPRGQLSANSAPSSSHAPRRPAKVWLALLGLALAASAAYIALGPLRSTGLRLLRTIEVPGVWDWSTAVIGSRGAGRDIAFFAPSGQDLLLLSAEGQRITRWTLPRGEGDTLRPYLAGDHLPDGVDEVLACWRYRTNLTIALLNQNPYALRTFRAEGATEETDHGTESRSDLMPLALVDLEGDGRRELLARVMTGSKPHFAPRGVLCFDFESATLRWRHLTGGAIVGLVTLDLNGDGTLEVVFGTDAVQNGNVAPDGTADDAAYLRALRSDGELLWVKQLGGPYTRVFPLLARTGPDQPPALLAWLTGAVDHWPAYNQPEIGPVFRLSATGVVMAQYEAGVYLTGCLAADLDGDGHSELYLGDRHGTLRVLNPDLALQRTLQLVANRFDRVVVTPVLARDLDSDGRPDLVLRCYQLEIVSGLNPGDRAGEPNIRVAHDNQIIVLNHALRRTAHFQVAKRWDAELNWEIHAADFTGDGQPELVSLADKALVLERVHRRNRTAPVPPQKPAPSPTR